jgi:hypothetical protein
MLADFADMRYCAGRHELPRLQGTSAPNIPIADSQSPRALRPQRYGHQSSQQAAIRVCSAAPVSVVHEHVSFCGYD